MGLISIWNGGIRSNQGDYDKCSFQNHFRFVSHFCLPRIFLKMKTKAGEAVNYSCIRGLDGRISDCKFRMHVKCFHELEKSFILDPCSRQSTGNNGLDRFKSCCHHSLKNLCVITDGTWWKKKKYSHQKDIGNCSDGCIICLKSFSVLCVCIWKKSTDCMVCSIHYDWFLWLHFCNSYLFLDWFLIVFMLNCFLWRKQMTQASCFP